MPPSPTPASPPTTPPARLWLIRHGQTDWNLAGRIQGQTPTDLNATGRAEAHELAQHLSAGKRIFAACYSSDLPRARQTAEILGERLHIGVRLRAELREREFGLLEGAFPAQIRAARAAAGVTQSADLADWTGMPGVESNDALWCRASAALHQIAPHHPDQDVLIVTHGGVIARLLYRVLGIPDGQPRKFPMGNAMVVILEASTTPSPDFRLLTLADMQLLAGDPPTPDTATMR